MELRAPPHWKSVDLISDLHLQNNAPATVNAWQDYLLKTSADAVFMLGDIFEVWVGDDASGIAGSFEAACEDTIRHAAQHRNICIMHGNRDFLLGPAFAASCNATLLDDPTIFCFGNERMLLTHGDALCLDDHSYQLFRNTVRSADWQTSFLAKPLVERQMIAKNLREQSAKVQAQRTGEHVDLDAQATIALLNKHVANRIIHGHTHHPADHHMTGGRVRMVLTDWDLTATPIRAEILRLSLTEGRSLKVQRLPYNSALI